MYKKQIAALIVAWTVFLVPSQAKAITPIGPMVAGGLTGLVAGVAAGIKCNKTKTITGLGIASTGLGYVMSIMAVHAPQDYNAINPMEGGITFLGGFLLGGGLSTTITALSKATYDYFNPQPSKQ